MLPGTQVAAAGCTLPAVIAARALVGLGEGVALPCMNSLIAVNIPPARRATALGTAFSGFHSGECWYPRLNAPITTRRSRRVFDSHVGASSASERTETQCEARLANFFSDDRNLPAILQETWWGWCSRQCFWQPTAGAACS